MPCSRWRMLMIVQFTLKMWGFFSGAIKGHLALCKNDWPNSRSKHTRRWPKCHSDLVPLVGDNGNEHTISHVNQLWNGSECDLLIEEFKTEMALVPNNVFTANLSKELYVFLIWFRYWFRFALHFMIWEVWIVQRWWYIIMMVKYLQLV